MATTVPTVQQVPTGQQVSCVPVAPDLSLPLINEPEQACPTAQGDMVGALELLVGTWTNQALANGQGGCDTPYSYNVMVLPQSPEDPSSPQGYILKNMQYYEEITFSSIHGNAANRGGAGVQVGNPLFYEQRIYISSASGAYIEQQVPALVSNTLVHAENGAWLVLTSQNQCAGPYSTGEEVPGSIPPTGFPTLVKQIAVPHGNSVLALGEAPPLDSNGAPISQPGSPTIPTPDIFPSTLPLQDLTPYGTQSAGNPNVEFTNNPNLPLSNALAVAPVGKYIMFQVDSNVGQGQVTNIGFEQQHADVVQYSATYWLEALGDSDDFTQLQYTQTIVLRIPINGQMVEFPAYHLQHADQGYGFRAERLGQQRPRQRPAGRGPSRMNGGPKGPPGQPDPITPLTPAEEAFVDLAECHQQPRGGACRAQGESPDRDRDRARDHPHLSLHLLFADPEQRERRDDQRCPALRQQGGRSDDERGGGGDAPHVAVVEHPVRDGSRAAALRQGAGPVSDAFALP